MTKCVFCQQECSSQYIKLGFCPNKCLGYRIIRNGSFITILEIPLHDKLYDIRIDVATHITAIYDSFSIIPLITLNYELLQLTSENILDKLKTILTFT